MPKNKNQHIVPQFYQRQFSYDGETIGKYVIRTKEIDVPCSIKKTASENYFYDDKESIRSGGQTVESSMGVIESGAAIAIKKLVQDGEILLSPKEHQFLYTFIGLQVLRTKAYAKKINEDVDKFFKMLLYQHCGSKYIDSHLVCEYEKPQVASLKYAAPITLSLLDLRYKVLEISIPDSFFLTSDNPVSQFNPFLYKNKIYNQGPALVGSLVFMPISPVKGILLYDSQIYKIGTRKSNVTKISQKSDVDSLNLLACLNAYDELLFNPQNQQHFCFSNLIERVSKLRNIERKKYEPVKMSETESVFAYIPQKVVKTELSFVKVLDKARSYHLQNVLWDPVLIRPTCQLYNSNQDT
ncbi:MAG: DUF4238 domain-containing protein [Bacteroidaceae bacterium]|nr:DUF4238 domain-containing protein [Bacteroidaceae bacterium]